MNSFFQKINIFKHNRLLVISLIFFVVFSYVIRTAFATPLYDYTNTVTDPSCEPTNVSCTVSNFPDDTGHAGEFLTADGAGVLTWDTPIASIDIGTLIPSGVNGSVLFIGSGGLARDAANFFWDDANNRLGIGDATPSATFTVGSGDKFQIDSSGNIIKINDVTYSWPASQAATAGHMLSNNGSGTLSWKSPMRIGSSVEDGAQGSIYFGGTSGVLAQDNTNFFWDDSNNRLGVNDNTPSVALDVNGVINVVTQYNIGGEFFATQTPSLSTSSIRIGQNAGNDSMNGNANTVIGNNAGNDLTTGYMNTFLGTNSGAMNTSGGGNVFLGSYSGSINSTGATNTFVGVSSGEVSTTGSNNAFLGYYSGFRNTTGATNTFVGVSSGESNTTGLGNAFLGYQAGLNQDHDYQVAVGYQALRGANSSTAATNTAIGYKSGYAVTSAANNIFLGYQAGDSLTTGSNNIVIGHDIDTQAVSSTNTLSIGNLIFGTGVDGTGTALSSGNIGIGVAVPAYRLDVAIAGDGIVGSFDDSDSGSCTVDPGDGDFSCSSDVRLKKNISNMDSVLHVINSLRPVRYNWNSDEDGNPTKIGFIAQEVDALLPELVTTYNDGYLGLNYAGFTPVLTKAIQELDLKIIGIENFTDETFISRLREWLGSVTNGLEKLYAGKIETYEIQTQKLCVGSRCITESEFIELLDSNGIGNNENSGDVQVNDTISTEDATEEELHDGGDIIEETQIIEEIIVENQAEVVPGEIAGDPVGEIISEEGSLTEPEITQ